MSTYLCNQVFFSGRRYSTFSRKSIQHHGAGKGKVAPANFTAVMVPCNAKPLQVISDGIEIHA